MSSKSLKAKAVRNTTVSRNKSTVKEGIPNDHSVKHGVPIQSRTVGMSKGVTRNMGDYESLRVDVWLTDYVQDNETYQEALSRVEGIIDEVLEDAVLSMV